MAEEIKEKPAKKKFQMPNTYVILFAVIAFIALLTWFVPGGAYELSEGGDAIAGTYHVVESNPQGLWDIFMAPITGMLGGGTVSGAISISLTIMLFGSLLEMMDRTCALKTAIKRITITNQNNMHALIAILVILMAFFGTLEGAYEEGIVYFLMFVPVILALGLDTVTAIMIVVLGTQIGCPFGHHDCVGGVVGAGAGDDGNAFVDLLDADADSGFMFVVGHRGGFAGGAAGHEAVDALFDLPFDEFTVSFLIDLAVLERRHQCGESSVETSGSHNNPLSVR